MALSKLLITVIIAIGFQLIRYQMVECSVKTTKWTLVEVEESVLQSTTLPTKEIDLTTEESCAIYATRSGWANLFCCKDNNYRLFGLLAVPSWNDSLLVDPANCMTKVEGCVYNNQAFAIEDSVEPRVGEFKICLKDNIMLTAETTPAKQKYSTCDLPFKSTSVGCIAFFTISVSFGDAVMYCRTKGAVLASLELLQTKAQLSQVNSVVSFGNAWFGARLYGTQYNYTMSRNHLPDNHPVWYFSASYRYPCLYLYSYGSSGFRGDACSSGRHVVCERIIE